MAGWQSAGLDLNKEVTQQAIAASTGATVTSLGGDGGVAPPSGTGVRGWLRSLFDKMEQVRAVLAGTLTVSGTLAATPSRASQGAGRTYVQAFATRTTAGSTTLRVNTATKKVYITDIHISGTSGVDTAGAIAILDGGTILRVVYQNPRAVSLSATGTVLGTQQAGVIFYPLHFDEPLQFSTNITFTTGDASVVSVGVIGYEE